MALYAEYCDPMYRLQRDMLMSNFIIADYCGKFPSQFNDRFLEKSVDLDGNVDFSYVLKISQLADSLFMLSGEDVFCIMVERLLQRSVRSVFFEICAAAYFKRRGFKVVSNRESGKRGSDFDFCICRGDSKINIEVSEIAVDFRYQALTNKFKRKMNQVPKDAPAILFLTFPSSWFKVPDRQFCLMKSTFDFFSKSRRYNAVMFQSEISEAVGEGLYWLVHIDPFENSKPYHPANLSFIYQHGIDVSGSEMKALSYEDSRRTFMRSIVERGGSLREPYSFSRWVVSEILNS